MYTPKPDLLEQLGGIPEDLITPPSVALDPSSDVLVNSKLARGKTSSVDERALVLLGSGVSGESAALALGVTASYISQLMAAEEFSSQVATLRYENLQQHNQRDATYDGIEDKLLEKLEKSLPFMIKPQDILRAVSTINGAKRRGQSAPDQIINSQNIVNLVLPAGIAAQFSVSVNIDNQVTKAGDQELHTMPSGNLLKQVEQARLEKIEDFTEAEVLPP